MAPLGSNLSGRRVGARRLLRFNHHSFGSLAELLMAPAVIRPRRASKGTSTRRPSRIAQIRPDLIWRRMVRGLSDVSRPASQTSTVNGSILGLPQSQPLYNRRFRYEPALSFFPCRDTRGIEQSIQRVERYPQSPTSLGSSQFSGHIFLLKD